MRWLLVCLLALLTWSCEVDLGDKTDKSDEAEDDDSAKKKKRRKKGESAPAKKTDPSGWTFVRQQSPMDAAGVDACAWLGGTGMACLDALLAEKDDVKRDYMRLLSDANARLSQDSFDGGNRDGVAHAEIAMFCAESGPCKQGGLEGSDMDDGYACLTKAEASRHQGDQAAAKQAHARACKCDPKRAQIPVMGGTLACDGKDKAVSHGKKLSSARAKTVHACSVCDAEEGAKACASEIDHLRKKDAKLADYLLKTHVPRCQQP